MKTLRIFLIFIFTFILTISCKDEPQLDTNSVYSGKTQFAIHTIGFKESNNDLGIVIVALLTTPDNQIVVENVAFRYSEKNINNITALCESFYKNLINKSSSLSKYSTIQEYIMGVFQSPQTFKSSKVLKNEELYKLINFQSFSLASANGSNMKDDFFFTFLNSIIPSAHAQSGVQAFVIAYYGMLFGALAGSVISFLPLYTLTGSILLSSVVSGLIGAAVVAAYNQATGRNLPTLLEVFGGSLPPPFSTGSNLGYGGVGLTNDTNDLLKELKDALGGSGYTPPNPVPDNLENLIDHLNDLLEKLKRNVKNFNPNSNNGNFSNSTSWGDPHLKTFDGLVFDYQGHGEFIVVKSIEDNFEVQVRQEDIRNTSMVTFNTAIAINTDYNKICITASPLRVFIDQKNISVPDGITQLRNSTSLIREGNRFRINLTNGDRILVNVNPNSHLDYDIILGSQRKNKVVGMMGNYDGIPFNDLVGKNSQPISKDNFNEIYTNFSDTWRISQNKSLFVYDSGKSTDSYSVLDFPKKSFDSVDPTKLADAERTCRANGITDAPYLRACAYDLAITGNSDLIKSTLFSMQNQIEPPQTISNDISYFQNLKVSITKSGLNQSDSCLISFSEGKVYPFSQGAANARNIDYVLTSYCDFGLHTPNSIMFCAGSCGIPVFYNLLKQGNWSVYNIGDMEGAKSNPTALSVGKWNAINDAEDISNFSILGQKPIAGLRSSTISSLDCTLQGNVYLFDDVIFRFVTSKNKRGFLKLNKYTNSPTKYIIEFDVKIEK